MKARTIEPIQPPVTVDDVADFLVLPDSSDPGLTGVLIAATSAVIERLGYDLKAREWTATQWDWPVTGTRISPSLAKGTYKLQREISLPYAGILDVLDVELYGMPAEFVQRDDSIVIQPKIREDYFKTNEHPAIFVRYRAGFGETAEDVPQAIKEALIMLAGYMYEHRGCKIQDAMSLSGAGVVLAPYVRPDRVVVY